MSSSSNHSPGSSDALPTPPRSGSPAGGPASRPTRPAGSRGSRASRDQLTTIWLLLAGLAALAHHWWPTSGWVVVHLLLLGALSHSVLVWSTHFAQTLLKTSPDIDPVRHQSLRLWVLTAGSALVVVGVPTSHPVLVMVGATLVMAAVAWHAVALWRRVRAALPGRFRITLRYYLLSCVALVAGATFGILLSLGPDAEQHGRLLVAHTMSMLLGWFGLTVTGTLITLAPTMLRTRMDDRAERLARQALPVLVLGVAAADVAALLGSRWGTLVALLAYLAGLVWWGRALVRPATTRPPHEFASASVACGLLWAVVATVRVVELLARGPRFTNVYAGYGPVAALAALGFGLQMLLGALSYLIPMALGGGPTMARALTAQVNRFGVLRLVLTNAAVASFVLPMASPTRTAIQLLGLVAAGAFIPLMAGVVRTFVAARRTGNPPADPGDPAPFWTPTGIAVAVAALVAAGAVASGTTSPQAVVASGHTTAVTITARDMHFTPNRVTVNRGDRLVLTVVNADATSSHDLVLSSGAATAMIAPQHRASLDAGVMSQGEQGWCSVPGHRQMGMTLTIDVLGASGASPGTSDGSAGAASVGGGSASGVNVASLAQTPFDPGFVQRDPVLAPLTGRTGVAQTHTVTWHIHEQPVQVAPGVWQVRWTYDGVSPGPVLHGRVGDRFVVTIVNDTTMGHSIDFHAGEVAPDPVMRTIAPGEHLTYAFTADHAGAWLYHCSTAPMTTHISAGMFGAVVIEPDQLAPVARSYLFVQSEVWLGASTSSASPAPVDATRIGTGATPDALVFNGTAFQYLQQPLPVTVGEHVRIWVVDAGPNTPLSFHVVGGQFDTTWAEGAYLLRPGGSGGSQVLSLGAAQGGFVEMTFRAPGHYKFVNHALSDAERGAAGFFLAS